MKSRISKAIVLVALGAVAFTPSAWAILGLGDIVFDPSNYAQAIRSFIQLEHQYAQLIQIYQQARQQYEQLLWEARMVPVNMQARYRAVVTPWTNSTATNTYGTTAGWINAVNTGNAVESGYAQSIQPLVSYGSAFSNIPAEQADRIKSSYGTVEITDGANVSTMETIGRMRANSPILENTLRGLEDDSLSSDPEMNTEIAVLNKLNAASLIGLRNSQDTNKLLVNLAEHEIVAAKRTRDAEAQAIEQHVRFLTDGKATLAAQALGVSDAMLAWRMP
jgi:type IV secretion system protein TrbJ